jgi:hypothetical protein
MSDALLISEHIELKKKFDQTGIVLTSLVQHNLLDGPVMCIRQIDFPVVLAEWFDNNNVYRTQTFKFDALTVVS